MYIWTAADVSRQLAFVRERATELNRELNLSEVAFSLPQHISLKISFEVDDSVADEVISVLEDYLSSQTAFTVGEAKVEIFGSILWLSFPENECLKRLHRELDELLLSRFGVPLHEYDKCFKFHSTLFIDGGNSLGKMCSELERLTLPSEIETDSFLIGISKSGKAGEYRVIKEIPAIK